MKFKVGQKINIYTEHGREVGIVRKIHDDMIEYHHGELNEDLVAHYKQCRSLKKKEPKYYYFLKHHFDNFASSSTPIYSARPDAAYVKVRVVKE